MNDLLFDSGIFVFETIENTPGGSVQAFSFDGVNYTFASTGGEVSTTFVN